MTKRSIVRTSKYLGLFLALVATAMPAALKGQVGGIAVGTKAPAVMVETLAGAQVDLASYLGGKPVVMEFWATWCPLCRGLEPSFEAAQRTYGDRIRFVRVGVPDNQTPAQQKAYVDQKSLGGDFVFDRDGKAVAAYKVPHTSFILVIDAAGTVTYTGVGSEQSMDAVITKALAADRP